MFDHEWPRFQCKSLDDFISVLSKYQSLKVPTKEKIYIDIKISGPELNNDDLQLISCMINTCFIDEINILACEKTVALDNLLKIVV
jgi:hypothetical protein